MQNLTPKSQNNMEFVSSSTRGIGSISENELIASRQILTNPFNSSRKHGYISFSFVGPVTLSRLISTMLANIRFSVTLKQKQAMKQARAHQRHVFGMKLT